MSNRFSKPALAVTRYPVNNAIQAYKTTVRLIGEGIRKGSEYLPIRQYAAGLATTAGPKDYLGQVKAIYDDFTRRAWRYVKEPGEIVHTSGRAIFSEILGHGARPGQRGFGDCDDATTALGACFAAIGLPVQIVTTAPPHSFKLFTHVFPRVHVPRLGWIAADAVGYPKKPLGWIPPAQRRAFWDLQGRLVETFGDVPATLGDDDQTLEKKKGVFHMPQTQYPDYGLAQYGLAGAEEPLEFATYGLKEFGAFSPVMGLINNYQDQILAEVDEEPDAIAADGTALHRTKMLEISPADYAHVIATGSPRPGSVALGDDGTVYQYIQPEGLGAGFFKRLFRKARGFVKGVVKKVRGVARKVIRALPGGKYLLKIYGKIRNVAMKLVRPLMKFVGKYASKLAPIAALIPGYGTAIAGALYTAGKIAKVMQQFDVKTDKAGHPKFKSPKHAHAFAQALRSHAEAAKKTGLVQQEMQRAQAMRGPRAPQAQRRARPQSPRAALRAFMPPVSTAPASYAPRLLTPGTKAHSSFLRGLGFEVAGL